MKLHRAKEASNFDTPRGNKTKLRTRSECILIELGHIFHTDESCEEISSDLSNLELIKLYAAYAKSIY